MASLKSEISSVLCLLDKQLKQRQFSQAIETCKQWITLSKNSPHAYLCLSDIYLKINDLEASIFYGKKALAEDPLDADLKTHLSHLYMTFGVFKLALEVASSIDIGAIQKDHNFLKVAEIYTYLGEPKKALTVLKLLLAKYPNNAEINYRTAVLSHQCNDVQNADTLLTKTLTLDPKRFKAHMMKSYLKKQSREKNNIATLLKAKECYRDSTEAKKFLSYSLFKEYSDIGCYDDATECILQFNHIAKNPGYTVKTDELEFKALKESFNTSFIEEHSSKYLNNEAIFILGMPRTGSTLIERMISMHQDVCSLGELQNFSIALAKALDKKSIPRLSLETLAQRVKEIEYADLGESYIESTRPRSGKVARFIDKMPFNFKLVGPILMALPNAKIIHVTRDPLDTCFSNFKQYFRQGSFDASNSIETTIRYYFAYEDLMKHWQRNFPDKIHTVSYEELIANPEDNIRQLLSFCELPWQEKCLNFHHSKQPSQTASTAQVRNKLYSSSIGQWQKYPKIAEVMQRYFKEIQENS